MKLNLSVYYWFALFAVCFVIFQQIMDHIRPNYDGNNWTIKYLLGIAPNFFPGIGIPALFVIIIPTLKLSNKWFTVNRHVVANLISLTGLIAWEFIQAGSTKLYFDWNDILWTLIGAFIFQLIWTVTPGKYKTT